MSFIKNGETTEILNSGSYPVGSHLHNPMMERLLADPEVLSRFEKVAADLKAVAPKAKDFLYFSAIMMHAAEAALLNDDGSIKKKADGVQITSSWDKSDNTWKWVCSDSNIKPYKNANSDIFPEEELKKAHKNWIGRPLCLDHKSNSVDHIRGVIVDTYYDEPKKRVIALCALDKLNYPDLARKVESKYATNVSMGTAVGKAICYDCGKVAKVEQDFCDHMRNKSCYGEINIDLKPIELSIVVNGADPNAKIKHIIAAAKAVSEYTEMKENQISKLSMHEMVDPETISGIKKDLESIMKKVEELENSAERVEEIEEKEETGGYPQENETKDEDKTPKEASLTDKLVGVLSGLHSKLDKLQDNINKLQRNGEDTMTNKQADLKSEAYFQGGGGENEPTPGKPKYEKEDSDSIRDREDKQMVGAKPFPDVGSTDGLYGDDLKKKEMLLRAEKEERAMRRQAAVDRAKASLKSEAYFQGGGGANEPTPGKPKYEKEDSDSIRDKEDKQMVGAKPFPDVGAVDGLYGDDLKKKEMLLRAHLKGKFVKMANKDGSENKSESRWDIFADDKLILTATVNELTNGRTDILYDSVANKEFGKKMLGIIRTNDFDKAKSIIKGAQAAAPAPMPAELPAAPSMPEMPPAMSDEPRDAGGTGDPKEDLPSLLTTAENTLADIRAAVEALLEESQSGLEGFDELSDNMNAEAAHVVGLNKLSKKVGKAMLLGMKNAEKELSEQVNELKMAKHVSDNRHKVRDEQKGYVDSLVSDTCVDTHKVIATCVDLMKTFVKYADGTKAVEKRAEAVKSSLKKTAQDPLVGVDGTIIPMSEEEQAAEQAKKKPVPGTGYRQPAKPKAPTPAPLGFKMPKGLTPSQQADWLMRMRPGREEGVGEMLRSVAPVPSKGQPVMHHKEPGAYKTGPWQDTNDGGENLELDVELPGGTTLKNVASETADDLTTKEGRAAAREKIAAKAMKWNPVLDEAHPSGGTTTQLDVKPEGDLAKVETLDETHDKMMDVAQAPPRVRQAAEEIQRLVVLGKIDPEKDFDELMAQGLDKDAVSYWKQYWGQVKGQGSQFASELVKEVNTKKKAEEDEAYRVKVARAYDLAHDMVRRGMLADDKTAVNSQVNELLGLSDKAFDSYKRFTEKQTIQKQASIPQVGMLSGEPNVVIPAPFAAQADLASELDAAFSTLSLKGRLF